MDRCRLHPSPGGEGSGGGIWRILRRHFTSSYVHVIHRLSSLSQKTQRGYPILLISWLRFHRLPSLRSSSILQSSQPASQRDIIVVSHSSSPRSHRISMSMVVLYAYPDPSIEICFPGFRYCSRLHRLPACNLVHRHSDPWTSPLRDVCTQALDIDPMRTFLLFTLALHRCLPITLH